MPGFVRVADIQEIPPGQGKAFPVRGREIAIFNVGGTFYAVKNSCPHRGVALVQGSLQDAIITCPGHSWQFDLRTGDALDRPSTGIRCYRVEIRGHSVWVEVP